MIQRWPLLLIAAGLTLLVSGFVYDVLYAGIPYQDPTPEISARYALHSNIAYTVRRSGMAIFFIGAVAGLLRLFAMRLRQSGIS